MQNLKVAMAQTELVWENPEENCRQLENRFRQLEAGTQLLVLPEMFSTGFSMNVKTIAEPLAGPGQQWMKEQARLHDTAITGSLSVDTGEKTFNRLFFNYPDGRIQSYDKKHLFRMAGEHKRYAAGQQRLIVDLAGWRICPLVCYDLRFPVWSRNRQDYDLLIYVANWPKRRRSHWRQLLIARAIENQAYVIGVNRIGTDGNGVKYSGDSLIISPTGELLVDGASEDGIFSAELDGDALMTYREKFPCHLDADDFTVV
ncbi:MAG: omega-amidase [Halieaceae bacterium]|jgi:omega-amidase